MTNEQKYKTSESVENPNPCPFCGGTTEVITDEQGYYRVSCIHCDYTSERYEQSIYAIAAHNRVARAVKAVKMRYVTYYYSFLSGLTDVTVHPDKESAVRFYRREAKHYFDVMLPSKTETPTACGFAHRRFGVMSIRLFRKNFPEWKKDYS